MRYILFKDSHSPRYAHSIMRYILFIKCYSKLLKEIDIPYL